MTTPEDRGSLSQVEVRSEKREQLLAEGRLAYPATVGRTHTLAEVREAWEGKLEPGEESGALVHVVGRVMFSRTGGKICFATLQEGDGTRLQAMLTLDGLGADELAAWKRLVDLGDHVVITGQVIASLRGELSVKATGWVMASKAIRPLPFLHAELSEETRVRQRYADLIVREEARTVVRQRSAILRSLRHVLEAREYIEVETPVLQPVHGGANARPFSTHLNAFDQSMALRIALELNLKKVVVGGLDKVFEMGKVFRNEGVDSSHSPEFTMLEAYEAYGDQETMAVLMKHLVLAAVQAAHGTDVLETEHGVIDFSAPWQWLSVYDAVSTAVDEPITPATSVERLQELAHLHGVAVKGDEPAGKLVMELCSLLVEPTLVQPTYLCDFPAEAQPLARRSDTDERKLLAWDLIIAGVEVGTAFTELIDPVVQRQVLEAQSLAAAGGDAEAMEVDEDFLRALEYGAPPMGGLGLGVDRLVMLLTATNIREAVLFPLLRHEV